MKLNPIPTIKKDFRALMVLVKQDYFAAIRLYKRTKPMDVARKAGTRSYFKWYAIVAFAIALGALVSIKHDDIIRVVKPFSVTVKHLPAGFLIPIALLVILSFPPLVGHEIVGIILGIIYGFGEGFAILAAGTFLGELATWFAFRWCCTARAGKFEKENKYYAALTQLIREKSFTFVLILRFSAIPGHVTTAISSSAGANFWSYCAAALLTLPKQLSLVYLGTAFKQKDATSHMLSLLTMFLTIFGTGVAAVYIYYQMRMYLIRSEALPTVAGEGDVPAGDLPAYEAGAEGAGGITLAEDEKEMSEVTSARGFSASGQPPRYNRRPFLHSASSYSKDRTSPTSRAKSLPGQTAADEITAYLSRLNYQGQSDAASVTGASRKSFDTSFQEDSRSIRLREQPSPPHKQVKFSADDEVAEPSGSGSGSRDSEHFTHTRGTASLDLWRPAHMTLGHAEREQKRRSGVVSGRDMANDADLYAVEHGARRPSLRPRGESTKSLLGRPESPDEDVDSVKGEGSV